MQSGSRQYSGKCRFSAPNIRQGQGSAFRPEHGAGRIIAPEGSEHEQDEARADPGESRQVEFAVKRETYQFHRVVNGLRAQMSRSSGELSAIFHSG